MPSLNFFILFVFYSYNFSGDYISKSLQKLSFLKNFCFFIFFYAFVKFFSDVTVLCRFAQLEYKHGDVQRGKTMFEKIVHSYSKKILVWNLFIDLTLKYENIIEAR